MKPKLSPETTQTQTNQKIANPKARKLKLTILPHEENLTPRRNYLNKRQLARPPTPTQASSRTTPTSTATRTVTPLRPTSTAPSRTKPKKVTNIQAKTNPQSASWPTPNPRKLAYLVEHFENYGNHGNSENSNLVNLKNSDVSRKQPI